MIKHQTNRKLKQKKWKNDWNQSTRLQPQNRLDQNRRAVAIKIARRAKYSRIFKSEVASYRTLNDTGEQIHFYSIFLIAKLINFIGFAPKLYAHFRNSNGLYVLVMELLRMSLASYMTALTDEVNHRMIIRIQVQMASFK